MSTSFLYHTFQTVGVKYNSTYYEENKIIFHAQVADKYLKCPSCHSTNISLKGIKNRSFRLPPIAGKSCFLNLTMHRIFCKHCNKTLWPHLPFMDGKSRMSRSFVHYALELLSFGTVKSIANFLKVGWDCIKDIHKKKLTKLYKRIPLYQLIYISIDEFSIAKGHKYMTIFTDIKSGRIIHAVTGKDKQAVIPFLRILAKKATGLKGIAMDMSKAFYSAVKEELPNIDIVFDRFHIMQLMNKALDDVRKEQQNKNGNALSGNRFILLANYESLDTNGMERLNSLLSMNQPLFIAYSLKEQLRGFWMKKNKEEGEQFLKQWCLDAIVQDSQPLRKIAKTIWGYSQELLNYFIHPISNGKAEGINNKIKTMKRQAYGFRDLDYFKLRLYHLHEQRYSLTG